MVRWWGGRLTSPPLEVCTCQAAGATSCPLTNPPVRPSTCLTHSGEAQARHHQHPADQGKPQRQRQWQRADRVAGGGEGGLQGWGVLVYECMGWCRSLLLLVGGLHCA